MEVVNETWLSNSIQISLEKDVAKLEKAQKKGLIITLAQAYIPDENCTEYWVFIRQKGLLARLFKKPVIQILCGTEENKRLIIIYVSPEAEPDLIQKIKGSIRGFARRNNFKLSIYTKKDPK